MSFDETYARGVSVQKLNCYLCAQTIGANDDYERVERGSLVLWAHTRCLAAQRQTELKPHRA